MISRSRDTMEGAALKTTGERTWVLTTLRAILGLGMFLVIGGDVSWANLAREGVAGQSGVVASGQHKETGSPEGIGQAAEFSPAVQEPPEEVTFGVKLYKIHGTRLFPRRVYRRLLKPYTGKEVTLQDVQTARETLEKFFHKKGFPRIQVVIPEQEIVNEVVNFSVLETRIGRVRVVGNKYHTMELIKGQMASLQPGELMHVPSVEKDFLTVNRTRDMKVKIGLEPTREPGVDNIELQVEDSFPLHGSVELNNRSTKSTSELRLNASLRYDNLWQKQHSIGLQYQTSPLDLDEVQVVGGSYSLPSPWDVNHTIAAYGIRTASETAFGEGFQVVGDGLIIGLRYVLPLPRIDQFVQGLTLGVDYKDFNETTGFGDDEARDRAPITYLPFSVFYTASHFGEESQTRFRAGLNFSVRGVVANADEFALKRSGADGNYIYLRSTLEHRHNLPYDFQAIGRLEAQVASEPLVSTEQISAGGASVRGYYESEELGDNGLLYSLEFVGPDWGGLLSEDLKFRPYAFLDGAFVQTLEPLALQKDSEDLLGVGLGFRGTYGEGWEYQADFGWALRDSSNTDSGDTRPTFKVRYNF